MMRASDDDTDIMVARRAEGVCPMCRAKPCYPGAIYCGAGCTARAEAGDPVENEKP